jgi:hypothetical protein
MPEIISCPSCRRKLQAPEALQGQDVQCPTCGTTFTADFGEPPVPPPPVVPPAPSAGEPWRPPPRRDRPTDDYGLDRAPDDAGGRRGYRERGALAHRGSLILTLGILGLVGLVICVPALILGPMAWAMGNNDLALIRAGRMEREGEGATSAGQTCGMIATILGIIGLVLACMYGVLDERGFFFMRRW